MASFLLANQAIEIEAQRGDVLGQVLGRLLERDADAGLAELGSAAHQELHAEQGFAAAGAAAYQGWPAERQAP